MKSKKRPYRFHYGAGGWHVKAGNGEIVADNQGHDDAETALDGILALVVAIKTDNFTVETEGQPRRRVALVTNARGDLVARLLKVPGVLDE